MPCQTWTDVQDVRDPSTGPDTSSREPMAQAKSEGGTIRVRVTSRGRTVTGEYVGGAYVELYFGPYLRTPIEVINVWDDETDESQIQVRRSDIKAEVVSWIEENDKEWPEWYEEYLENASYY